ncbi:hypothetical protein D3C85_1864160 [compost metagenome]
MRRLLGVALLKSRSKPGGKMAEPPAPEGMRPDPGQLEACQLEAAQLEMEQLEAGQLEMKQRVWNPRREGLL